jgi:sensor histidine kinase YesM
LGSLTHFAIVWLVINISYTANYIIEGRPGAKTPLEWFIYHTFYDSDTLVAILFCLLAEINYRYAFRRLNIPLFILTSLLTGIITITVLWLSKYDEKMTFGPVLFAAGYALLYALVRSSIYNIRHRKEIQLQQSRSELDTLKAQLNPHFLFNSLNYLYGTALNEKASLTADGIDKLSELMRYTISGIRENFVPLNHELKFIENYLALQRVRLPVKENIRVDITLPPPQTSRLQIAPMLLLPFIENAFKYGISMDDPCFIILKIEIINNRISMEIKNSITSKPAEKGNNIGIANTERRLKLLYQNQYTLKQARSGNEYAVFLTITPNS